MRILQWSNPALQNTLDLASHILAAPAGFLLFIYTRAPIPDLASLVLQLASFPAITAILPAGQRNPVLSLRRLSVSFLFVYLILYTGKATKIRDKNGARLTSGIRERQAVFFGFFFSAIPTSTNSYPSLNVLLNPRGL